MKALFVCSVLMLLVGCAASIRSNQAGLASAYMKSTYHDYENGLYNQAILDATKAIELKSDVSDMYNTRGSAYNAEGHYDQAISDYSEAIKIERKYYYFLNRCIAYNSKGLYDKAMADCTETIKIRPDFSEAYDNRGNSYDGKGMYVQAIADHAKAIELDPRYGLAYRNRGNSYISIGMYDKAISDENIAIRIDRAFASAYVIRGMAEFHKKLYAQAIADYTSAITIDPKLYEAYANRAHAYSEMGDYSQAIVDYTKAIEANQNKADPNIGISYNGLAWSLHKIGRDVDGLPYTEKALALMPREAYFFGTQAAIYSKLGQRDKAIADYRAAIQIDANNKEFKIELARLVDSP